MAADTPIEGLALIAPPLRMMPMKAPAVSGPFLIVVGAEDHYAVEGWAAALAP